ncbi:hypothetical protein [Zhihengliuella salsuginis]|nr:hypothetical protein [Zhihengliuella salsuginis]
MTLTTARYIRFEGPHPSDPNRKVGVFALANGLGNDGRLSASDHVWWRAANTFGNGAYPDPEAAVPGIYRENPEARAWFKTSAAHLISYTRGYLVLLNKYGQDCAVIRSGDPGRIIYEDDVQVVAVPHGADG